MIHPIMRLKQIMNSNKKKKLPFDIEYHTKNGEPVCTINQAEFEEFYKWHRIVCAMTISMIVALIFLMGCIATAT